MRNVIRPSIFLMVLMCGVSAYASILRHVLTDKSTPESAQMQGACLTLLSNSDHFCNPGMFPGDKRQGFTVDMILKAEEQGYEVANRLLLKRITKEDLDALFKYHEFIAYSGLARIEALYKYFSFSYTPLHGIAAVKVANPSLPEILATGVKQSTFRLISGYEYALPEHLSFATLAVGAGVFYYDRTFVYSDSNILETTVRSPSEVVLTDSEHSVDADLGIYAKSRIPAVPDVGLTIENISSLPETDKRRLDVRPYFRRRAQLGLGYTRPHVSGRYHLGLKLSFLGAFEYFDETAVALGFNYQIGKLQAFTAFSAYAASFGFLFATHFYQVGIEYTNEKQNNNIQFKRQNNVYLFTSFYI